MDTLRKTLWLSLALTLIGLAYTWQSDYSTQTVQQAPSTTPTLSKGIAYEDLPSKDIPKERQITFQTDVLEGMIDRDGGHLVYLALLNYPLSTNTKKPFVLLDHTDKRYYTAKSDLLRLGEAIPKAAWYHSKQSNYTLSQDQTTLCIDLYREEDGVTITKQFLLNPSQYQIDIRYQVDNNSQSVYKAQPYAELVQQKASQAKNWLSNTAYSGGVISSDIKPYEKLPFDQMSKKRWRKNAQLSWLAFVEPYFASAWIPKLPASTYYSHQHHTTYTLGFLGEHWEIEPGTNTTGMVSLYAGPKIADTLKKSAPSLDLLIDYGIFWFVATHLFWLLKQCHHWIHNWGWAIVCITILLKLSLYRLSAKQFRTTIAMRQLQTKLDALKARYANDQSALNQATIELYRREGVNPIKGSLVAFIQLPVSLALNAVLLESVELRHEPFVFWIKDLVSTDPYYIVPLLLGLTMFAELFIEQILTSRQASSTSQSMIMLSFIPLLFVLVAINFPAGLALFWLTQNICSVFQKWWLLGRPLPNTVRFFSKRSSA